MQENKSIAAVPEAVPLNEDQKKEPDHRPNPFQIQNHLPDQQQRRPWF
jgi:hypothetical protein